MRPGRSTEAMRGTHLAFRPARSRRRCAASSPGSKPKSWFLRLPTRYSSFQVFHSPPMTQKRPKAPAEKNAREARLAEALRANLARRKAQSRARKAPAAGTADEAASADDAAGKQKE